MATISPSFVPTYSPLFNTYHSKYVGLIQIHNLRKILIILIKKTSSDSNHSSKFTVLVIVTFTKEEKRKRYRQQAKQAHNRLVSIVVLVRESYLFCDS